MSIQRLCYFIFFFWGGGGGPSLKPSQGLGYRGKDHSSQGNRRTKGQINFEGKGNRENMGNKGTGTIFPPLEGLISSL